MVQYTKFEDFLESAADMKTRLERIRLIIDRLTILAAAMSTGDKSQIDSYTLNDGQVQITTKYKTLADVQKALDGFLALEGRYMSRLAGGRFRLIDGKNFRACS